MIDLQCFTIAVCTYNGSKTLPFVLDAIIKLEKFNELINEVLLIDNASTDNTKEICKSYQCKNPKIKYIYEPRQGLSFARQCAINTDAEWVIYVDDDNVLNKDWLIELKETILSNDNIGIINGAVIAFPTEKLDFDENLRLKVMYKNLACTHLYNDEINYKNCKNVNPFGAGLCVLTNALRKINDQGWLKLYGRRGTSLSSGEDNELAIKVLSLGYKYFFNNKMKLYHLIPPSRLSKGYSERLIIGLVKSRYQVISQFKFYIIHRSLRGIKYLLLYFLRSLQLIIEKPQKENKIIIELDLLSAKTFLGCLFSDMVIRR